ncbi:dihydrodipicolinate synthase family protein [Sphingomonas sp. UYEF23]|uniref:dihydrodipicolinate synthase family protein n=1 Tax=Sphingomonas sp. UYEF23 TaxID=1756408 RepID=UPI003394E741
MRIHPADINGMVGIVPTPASPDGDKWSTVDSLNLPETEKMIRIVVDAGIDIVLTNGTFGECATLTADEHITFTACVAQTIAGRVPFFAGVGTLNTRDTITRSKALLAAGADGLFIGRPMWLAMTQQQIVEFHRDLAEAMPGVPQIVYDNPVAFKGKIDQDAYIALAKIPEVVAAKHVGGPALDSDVAAVGDSLRILPVNDHWLDAARKQPDLVTAAWSGHTACAPAPLVALAKAIAARDWDDAARITARCSWATEAMMVGGDLAAFMNYSIPIGHLRFAAAGLIDPGPTRPPYTSLPDSYREGGTETGRRWAVVQREFVGETVAA